MITNRLIRWLQLAKQDIIGSVLKLHSSTAQSRIWIREQVHLGKLISSELKVDSLQLCNRTITQIANQLASLIKKKGGLSNRHLITNHIWVRQKSSQWSLCLNSSTHENQPPINRQIDKAQSAIKSQFKELEMACLNRGSINLYSSILLSSLLIQVTWQQKIWERMPWISNRMI